MAILGDNSIASLSILYVFMFPLFWCSGRMFGFWWDGYVDARRALSRLTVGKVYAQTLEHQLQSLSSDLFP